MILIFIIFTFFLLKNKPTESLSLAGAVAEVAVDYTKREHVFRLKLNNGGQYLFLAKDDQEMHVWLERTQAAIGSVGGASSVQSPENKTKSLPPQQRQSGSLSGPGGPSASLRHKK